MWKGMTSNRVSGSLKKSYLTEHFDKLSNLKQRLTDKKITEQEKDNLHLNITKLENEISELESSKNERILTEHVKGITNDEGGLNIPKMWKVRKKLCPKASEPPTLKKDKLGNQVTDAVSLKRLYNETYKERLACRDISPELSDLKNLKENLFEMRLKLSKTVKTEPWTRCDLEKVLKS